MRRSTRVVNCIKIGKGEVESTESLDMEWPYNFETQNSYFL